MFKTINLTLRTLRTLHVLIACSYLLFGMSLSAYAEDESLALTPATSAEEIALIYYNLKQKDPNFIDLAAPNVPAGSDMATVQNEINRLQDLFAKSNPDSKYIVIQDVIPFTAQTANQHTVFMLEDFNSEFFIPFSFQKLNLMIKPQEIDIYGGIPMSEDMLATFFDGYDGKAFISYTLHIRAKYASDDKILLEDGKEYALLIGDIAYLALLNRNGKPFWVYEAPWYGDTMQSELQGLYHKEKLLTSPELNKVQDEINQQYQQP
ncbi:MAG: hypothetical protein CL561_08630 [Alphaproteobacteria bacterium]|nr:hypothetical protein [Alphaproteobacteria bacterium]|tara:strand:- start:3062 stop:3853 length:792 start_codon:yes stop_codon:yes gene_type:complete